MKNTTQQPLKGKWIGKLHRIDKCWRHLYSEEFIYYYFFSQGVPFKMSNVPLTVEVLSTSPGTAPIFNGVPSDLVFLENLDLDHNIATVTARSSGAGALSYHIAGGNTDQSFSIDQTSGRIFVSGVIDYEVVQQYHLWIEARQSLPGSQSISAFQEVIIGVEDDNDNTPRFTEALYNVSIEENSMFGSPVVTVTADDFDSGENGNVKYTLDGPDARSFRINSNTGRISTYSSLNRETVDLYSLSVIAVDNVSNAMQSALHLTVQ